MMDARTKAAVFFAFLAIFSGVVFYVTTAIWLDCVSQATNNTFINCSGSGSPAFEPRQNGSTPINVIFLVVGQWSFSCAVFGVTLVAIFIISPGKITDNDRNYPKKNFFIIGFAQGLSSLIISFAVTGKKTAPFLQAILSNYWIPIQFIMSFIVLRRKPTSLKTFCASVIVVAEFVSLVPAIFHLGSENYSHEEGGAKGTEAAVWTILFVVAMVTYTFANTVMERSVQDETRHRSTSQSSRCTPLSELDSRESENEQDVAQVNLTYFLFCWTFFSSLTAASFFWLDLFPGFGTSVDMADFSEKLLSNVECLVGQDGCGVFVVSLGWLSFIAYLLGALAFAGLMRYSEGANFVVLLLALRTPIVYLFWTLFLEVERSIEGQSHFTLSLGIVLSVTAIIVTSPALIIYNTGLPTCLKSLPCCRRSGEDLQTLLSEPPVRSVNVESVGDEILTFRTQRRP